MGSAVGAPGLLEVLLWAFRRSERDTVALYNGLDDIMRLGSGGDMLNFGYWRDADTPSGAQDALCDMFAERARLGPKMRIADVGSGYGAPAERWQAACGPLDMTCININAAQLYRSASARPGFELANATATALPFADGALDRVVAFESAQHFRPLGSFISEARRVLRPGGMLALAIPVMSGALAASPARLGLLYLTWLSEHYTERAVISGLKSEFTTTKSESIGDMVYGPLASYYERNRKEIRRRLASRYPRYVERILAASLSRMDSLARDGTIDYLIVTCHK